LPEHDFLGKDKGMEPLGWIKTQSSERGMSPQDVTTQAKIMAANTSWGPQSICVTCAFTPGSISLNAWELSVAGFEWGRKNDDVTGSAPGYNPTMAGKVQLLLSDRILGTCLSPVGRVWNYGVGLTQQFAPTMPYSMTMDQPVGFWDEVHRPAAFLNFASMEDNEDSADVENALA
jgi:pre-mRNA-processing factor 8